MKCALAAVAVSFGFLEKDGETFYSSQMTIDKTGQVIDLYRRVSAGWKEQFAGKEYCEGKDFHAFEFAGEKVVIGLYIRTITIENGIVR